MSSTISTSMRNGSKSLKGWSCRRESVISEISIPGHGRPQQPLLPAAHSNPVSKPVLTSYETLITLQR